MKKKEKKGLEENKRRIYNKRKKEDGIREKEKKGINRKHKSETYP